MAGVLGGSTPDITPAQIIAVVGGAIGVALGLGLDVSQHAQDEILSFTKIIAPALVAVDAAIRGGRNYASGKRDALLAQLGTGPADLGDAGSRPTL